MSEYQKRMWMIQELASRKGTGEIVVLDTVMTFCEPGDPDQIEADQAILEAENATLRERCERLEEALHDAAMTIDDRIPFKNCSCHVSPPCSDCIEYGWLRAVEQALRQAAEAAKGGSGE